jgi:hypothetical protein
LLPVPVKVSAGVKVAPVPMRPTKFEAVAVSIPVVSGRKDPKNISH